MLYLRLKFGHKIHKMIILFVYAARWKNSCRTTYLHVFFKAITFEIVWYLQLHVLVAEIVGLWKV